MLRFHETLDKKGETETFQHETRAWGPAVRFKIVRFKSAIYAESKFGNARASILVQDCVCQSRRSLSGNQTMAISPKRQKKDTRNAPEDQARVYPESNGWSGNPGAARLAEFFPGALSMRMPVRIQRAPEGRDSEVQGVIEFGTPREVILTSRVPFEFGELLRIVNANCSLDTRAKVVAMQICGPEYALVLRFAENAKNWIIQE